jgi:hypothetical protein
MTAQELKPRIEGKIEGCFLCKWTVEDLDKNGKLTNHPGKCNDGNDLFPARAKVAHAWLERVLTRDETKELLETVK